ncbi:MAG TPA: STAS domain-containing protein [Gemmataceae bacterium]|nr:STAS domain-containing protein [Gemmataceae bacterium]
METNLTKIGDVTVVELLVDSLDAFNSAEMKAELGDVAAAHPKTVVDLGRVKFVDSSGCGALVAVQKQFHTGGGDLRLCNPTPNVKTVLDMVRLNRVLGMYPTRELAVASFTN